MYILFSPSEGKKLHGNFASAQKKELLFAQLHEKRLPLLKAYNELILNGAQEELHKLTGIKKKDEIEKYQNDLFESAVMPALERYDGVAYDYLKLSTLSKEEKDYLFKQTIVFSNLFGPILGGDLIPAYKLKQGATVDGVATEKVYKKEFSDALDELLEDELILDLRAGYYEKFYTLDRPFITMKFLKGGKSVSHWAKAYRGKVLRALSRIQPKSEEELLSIEYKGLKFIETVKYKKGKMLVYEVL